MTATHEIAVWFLVLGLIFPRLTLLVAYFGGVIPWNNVPFWGDVVMAIFLPRVLIMIYIYGCMGADGVGWIIAYIVATTLAYFYRINRKMQEHFRQMQEHFRQMAKRGA